MDDVLSLRLPEYLKQIVRSRYVVPVATKRSHQPLLIGNVLFAVCDMPLGLLEKVDLRLAVRHSLRTI